MKFFKEWFKMNLRIGAYPNILDFNSKYKCADIDIIINVSDCLKPEIMTIIKERNIDSYWFPMNESTSDIGLNSIYGAIVVLRKAEIDNKKVFIHCWGGNNRSQTVTDSYFFLRQKQQPENEYKGFKNHLIYNAETGHLPSIEKMELFLSNLDVSLNNGLKGGDLDANKVNIEK